VNELLDSPLHYRLLALFAIGVCVGGALNWAIYSLGWTRRAISPWSDAPAGAPPRQLWDLAPVLGWLFLRRETPVFGPRFWVRPLLLELMTGALFAGLYWWEVERMGLLPVPELSTPAAMPTQGPRRLPIVTVVPRDPWLTQVLHVQFAAHALLISLMIAASFIDIDDQIIPDAITMPGTLLALVLMAVFPWALPPELGYQMPLGDQFVDFVMLTSPGAWPPWLNGLAGNSPLLLAWGCFWLWCFALLPRRWRGRRGWNTALAVMTARVLREPFSWLVFLLAGLGTAWIWMILRLGPPNWQGLLSALVGLAASAGLVWGVRLIGAAVLRREAMGFGDVTLMAMIGAFLGWQAGVLIFFLAPFFAVLYGLMRMIIHREAEIPYGPFLCMATLTVIVGWRHVWEFTSPRIFGHGWLAPIVILVCMALVAVLLTMLQAAKAAVRGPDPQRLDPQPAESQSGE
jgi:leader peptidase (prepilin peptidase) / N-methyltransferase